MPTIEQMLGDLCYWEDPDQILQMSSTEEGGVMVTDNEWSKSYEAPTLQEALFKMWSEWKHDEEMRQVYSG